MRKRNNRVWVRLNDEELGMLEKNLAKTKLPREVYLRQLITGVVPKELPSFDYISLTKQLKFIGNNINQIAMNSHKFKNVDSVRYDRDYKELQEVYKKLMDVAFGVDEQNGSN